ncbi:hypothetical protein K456DRAFT_1941457 [Colletotrichum gloeosporioides 23]|nr:hypothetical protein K456DRAFT_1941457 [Colletotrichum gloeosporioides 23]KAJ0280315.1 hypothetical protein COL940_006290 [Colletotrichum noveboracense]KAJ0287214.1 hypothetical protein CBS470a_005505 [Colletotrichum nupharicola]KAJ0318383.1 hypothetical protein Brms1b_004408 [Colletotrichum noveboracense]
MASPEVRQCKMIKEPGDDVPDEILEEILGCDLSQIMIDKQRGLIKDVEHHGKQIKEIDAGQSLANTRALEALALARRFEDVSQGQSNPESNVATQLELMKALDSRFQKELSLANIVNEAQLDLVNGRLENQLHGLTSILRTHVETVYDGMGKMETRMEMRDKAVLTRVFQFYGFILAVLVAVVAVQVKFFWF